MTVVRHSTNEEIQRFLMVVNILTRESVIAFGGYAGSHLYDR